MDLSLVFEAMLRSADAQERIAGALERIADQLAAAEDGAPVVATVEFTQPAVTAADEAPKKRGRKPKQTQEQQMAQALEATADEQPAAAPVAPPAPPVPPPTPPAPPMPPVAPPIPPVAPPPAPPVPAVADLARPDPTYESVSVEKQFQLLNQLVIPFFNVPAVRDALVNTAQQYGLGLPFSDPMDRSQPGDRFRSVSNEARVAIYHATFRAVEAARTASL